LGLLVHLVGLFVLDAFFGLGCFGWVGLGWFCWFILLGLLVWLGLVVCLVGLDGLVRLGFLGWFGLFLWLGVVWVGWVRGLVWSGSGLVLFGWLSWVNSFVFIVWIGLDHFDIFLF
jgi:hypothetical protein